MDWTNIQKVIPQCRFFIKAFVNTLLVLRVKADVPRRSSSIIILRLGFSLSIGNNDRCT